MPVCQARTACSMRRRAAFSGSAERAIGYEFHWLASPDVCVFEERPDIGAPVAARIITAMRPY